MIDPLAAIAAAFAHPTALTFFSVFLGGVLTSIGPCIAPRYIAIAAFTGTDRRSGLLVTAYAVGLIGTYVAFGWIAGSLGAIWNVSSTVYAALSVGLLAAGVWTIARPPHRHEEREGLPRSVGAVLLLGMASAFIASPCCTPIVATVISYSAIAGQPAFGAALLLSFALGHVAPLALIPLIARPLRRFVARLATAQGPAIVSGVLMLALGLFYGALA